jgi:hypothetical protein
MDRRERYSDDEESLRMALRAMQSRVWTAIPGIVQRFDAARMTVDVQPAINGLARTEAGDTQPLRMPVLLDCPVVWQGGGGVTLTFPVQAGDECLVVFGSRCIDSWWALGGVQDQAELRMHNLSDGFALCGLKSLPNAFPVNTTAAQLRADDGETCIELNPTAQTITAIAPGGITLNGVAIDEDGNVTAPGTITAPNVVGTTNVTFGGISGTGHRHGGIQTGNGTSGTPV